ncbi:MAG TPA: RDD family protein [Acidimicrobiales bacterium]|nr:RDD family protein [Acidimicrobiales bacterium]
MSEGRSKHFPGSPGTCEERSPPLTQLDPPANWYPDPDRSGGLRYWDGAGWTGHRLPPAIPGYAPFDAWGRPSWKGAQIGRPATGPGALAEPGHRLAARLLDVLVVLPVFVLMLVITLLIAAPHFGPIFPTASTDQSNGAVPFPGIFWIYLTVFATALGTGLVLLAYETVAVAKYGQTLGMAWLHIRPVRISGAALSWGRSFGRAAIYWLSWFVGWIGLLDPLWCLWDDRRQCLHDKVVDSIVINDLVSGTGPSEASDPA